MSTISCCMIVKNEEKILARCLDSICDLMDEIIIVDTGSTDKTKEIAQKYTDKIFDYEWKNDFSDARNFSFSKATMEYIYVPDADEYLDSENHRRFSILKACIDPQIDIVQMFYNTINFDTVLNTKNEYRPKLFKRLRTFTWIDPIHETVRLEPLVFNSDIVITHAPTSNHSHRDFGIFENLIKNNKPLSKKLFSMYATELLKNGNPGDFENANEYFNNQYQNSDDEETIIKAACVLVRNARINNDSSIKEFFPPKYTHTITSELCYDFALYYMQESEYKKAISWLEAAISEAPVALDIHTCGDLPLNAIIDCYKYLIEHSTSKAEIEKHKKELAEHQQMLASWSQPSEDTV